MHSTIVLNAEILTLFLVDAVLLNKKTLNSRFLGFHYSQHTRAVSAKILQLRHLPLLCYFLAILSVVSFTVTMSFSATPSEISGRKVKKQRCLYLGFTNVSYKFRNSRITLLVSENICEAFS